MKKQIPNIITLLNLTAGGIAATEAVNGNYGAVIWLIFAAALFDFADGLVARALHVKSDLGKELDSLADVVSFGLVPGLVVFSLYRGMTNLPSAAFAYLAFLLPALAAFRLAKFNLDTRQSDSFLGVPTPAMALFFITLPLSGAIGSTGTPAGNISRFITESWATLSFLVVVFGVLMISEVPLLALKFKNLGWKQNRARYILLAGSAILIIVLGLGAMPLVIAWYILFSAISNKLIKS